MIESRTHWVRVSIHLIPKSVCLIGSQGLHTAFFHKSFGFLSLKDSVFLEVYRRTYGFSRPATWFPGSFELGRVVDTSLKLRKKTHDGFV